MRRGEREGAYSEAHKEAEGPHRVCTPYLGNHLVLSSCNICKNENDMFSASKLPTCTVQTNLLYITVLYQTCCSVATCFLLLCKRIYFVMILSDVVFSPRQTVPAHGVAGGGAVALLEAVDESTVQTGLALLQAPVLLEATAPAGHTPGILSIAKATFLKRLTGEIHRVRGGVGGWGDVQLVKRRLECGLPGV